MFLNAIQTCIFPTPLSIEPFESFFTTGSRVSVTENNSNRFATHSHSKKQDLVTSTYAQLISYKSTEKKVTAPYTSSPLPPSSESPCKTYKHNKQTCTHIQRHKNHR